MEVTTIMKPDDEGKTKAKEKHLIVKPILHEYRRQEKKARSLKKGLSVVELQASKVTAMACQAAGRGVGDDKDRPGLLVSGLGHALKPIQPAETGGLREVEFYQKVSRSTDPEIQRWRDLAPKFYGIETVVREDSEASEHMVLENLISGMARPCALDIKPGRVTWPPEATREKIAKAASKCTGTKIPFGFGFQGMSVNNDKGHSRLDKDYGNALKATTVHTILENYLGARDDKTLKLAKLFQQKLESIEKFIEKQTAFVNFGCSVLFIYDHQDPNSATVRLIDFVHTFPGNGEIDQNFLFGLKNIRSLFESFLNQK